MTQPTVVVPIATGFEEIEAVTVVDVLRRAGAEVVVAGLQPGGVRGAHGVTIEPDTTVAEVDANALAMVVLPGGMPGAENLANDQGVQRLLGAARDREAWIGAICAAPLALAPAGITAGRAVTCYPGFEERVPAAEHRTDRVVVDGRLITSRGPGTALEFALTLVRCLFGEEKARELGEAMLLATP